jgi:hypothetical protein
MFGPDPRDLLIKIRIPDPYLDQDPTSDPFLAVHTTPVENLPPVFLIPVRNSSPASKTST